MDTSPKGKNKSDINDMLDDLANYLSDTWKRPGVYKDRKEIVPKAKNSAKPWDNDFDTDFSDYECPF